MSPPLQITEDTPPDMLAGSMDLCVVLPNGKDVRMSVERSTPMMDLLVQVTTANKISPAGHVIQAIGERGVMPYKPSTPIGALDTWTIYIVPKNQVGQIAGRKGYYKSVNQPFEQTFRLQVHLPRNQLYVSRISPKTRVSDILRQVCSEKNLDPSKYSLRHPVNLDQVLAGSCSLADYKLQEVALVSNRSRPVSGVSTVDIMALQQQRPVHATANHRSCEGSLSSGSLGGRSLSPTRSDESSASPPPLVPPVPHRPLRKRRPAPKPPVNNNNNLNNNVVSKNNSNNINSNPAVEASQPSQGATVICHSRNSSDSSGYHEASVLSESPESTNNSLPDSLPRRSKLPSNESSLESTSSVKSGGALSRSLSNLTTAVNSAVPRSIKTHSTSSTSLIAIGRKKKAAPAPPMARPLKMSSVSEERQKDISSPQSPLDDTSRKSSTLPATLRSTLHPHHSDVGSSSSSVCTPDTVDDLPASSHLCPSFDLLQNTPSELPKPKPRTIFETADGVDDGDDDDAASAVLSSSSSVDLVGDGCSDSTNSTICSQVVNKPKPVRSRKKRPAPLPKPRSSQSVVVCTSTEPQNNVVNNRLAMEDDASDSQQTNKIGDSQETVRVNEVDPNNCESVAKTDSHHDSLGENKSTCEKEVGKVDSGNVDDPIDVAKDCSSSAVDNESMRSECQEVFQTEEEVCPPDKVISITASSPSFPTSSTTNVKKVKSSLSEDGLVDNRSRKSEMLPDEKGRNFSVGNLNDVADFPKTQLGRWPNAECLPECSSLACANTEADTETKTESSTSDLRMDDEEIDRIFQNAMRDHTSLESGMGDEEGVALTLTEVTLPPPSPTQRPLESGPESLDWEYRLPAPPTFRDETSSPVMTVFDTVTIGNLTDVFRPPPPEPDLVNVDSPKDHNQGTSKLVNKHNKTVHEIVANKLNDNNEDKVKGFVNEIIANKLNDINEDKVGGLLEQSAKPDLIKHVEEEKARSNDVILNGDMENKENLRIVQDKVQVDSRSEKKTKVEGDNNCRLIDNPQKPKQPDVRGNVLDNFVIMTYQESGGKKPVEVFEDDSVTSSAAVNEKKSETRENSVFRIPKSVPRRFEPRLARRSSFGSEDKRSKAGPATVKRSASHVSLLAGNVARGHLSRSNGEPYIRNINSELNIAQGDEEKSKLADWRNSGSVGLQSLQVLRSILPQLNNSHDSINADNDDYNDNRNPDIRVASDLHDKFERSHSEEVSSSERHALHAAPAPAVSFATWNERPKRQVSIKTDRDYCYGINKLKSHAFDQRDTTEPKQSVVNFSSDMRHNDLDKPDIIKHSSADLSHVPVVRAVELKKKPYFSSSCVDVTDLGRCGFFHGRSYENLSCLDNSATFSKSSTLKPTAVSSKESFKSQQSVSTEEEASAYSGVNSLLRKFGQQKPTSTNRPVSCYLYGSGAYNNNKLEENSVPRQTTGNTSRVMLNSDKRFTSVVGINNDELGSNSVPRKEFTSQYEKPTSRVMVNGTSHNDDRFVNNSKDVKNAVNSSLEFIKAQSKISSGGFVVESPPRKIETDIPVAQSTTSPPPTAVPAKSILKPSKVNKPQSGGGIPPPPPVMPTLKPVGERRQTRTLPRVETDPRDQLLESIRNFGGLKSLKKSSSK